MTAELGFSTNRSAGLANFKGKVSAYYSHDPALMPRLRLEIPFFNRHGDWNTSALSLYKPTTLGHGHTEKAYEYIKEKMDIVQTFSNYPELTSPCVNLGEITGTSPF